MQLWCTFSVRYQHAGKSCVLMPGQALPVYDADRLGRCGPETDIVLVTMSVRASDEEFVPAPGTPHLTRERYRGACDLQAANQDTDIARAVVQQAKMYPMGGASAISMLRPHALPVGVGVYATPSTSRDPRPDSEERPLTMAQAEPIARQLAAERKASVFLPLPKLYAERADGTGEWIAAAVGVESPGQVRLVETLLPVCACPLGDDVDVLELCSKAVAHLRRLGAVRVWLGLDLLKVDHPDQPYVVPDPVTVTEVQQGRAASPQMYALPHGSSADYWLPLRFATKSMVNALWRGQDRLDMDFFPMYQGSDVRYQAVPPVVINVLEESGLPVS
jgi:hypothetical protein